MMSRLNYLVILLCATFLEAVKFRCDYNYTVGLGWFKYHNIPATWPDARFMCQLEGGILASPTTSLIKSAMLLSSGKNDIFTGIHSTFSRGHFYTLDGIPLTKIDHTWELLEPDNKENAEKCTALNGQGNLSDVRCDELRPYVCFRKHFYQDTNTCGTPDAEYHFHASTNKCYKLHTTHRRFERAHFACSAEGGHLAIINSEEESKIFKEILNQYGIGLPAFIGFHNWGEDGDWMTVQGQSLQEAGFAKFHEGAPDNATTGEYCGSVMPSGLLNDLWCEESYPFICEKTRDYPPVCDTENADMLSKVSQYLN